MRYRTGFFLQRREKVQVVSLIDRGYVEKDGDLFKITPRGENVLTDRGAGLNES
jgi:hypothetical protein